MNLKRKQQVFAFQILGVNGGSPPGPRGHLLGFPMVFIVVVVLLLLLVKFERWSGPVNGFGCTRSSSLLQFIFVCLYFISSGNIVRKEHYKRKGGQFI